jgi:hypothetical protein
MIDPRREYLDLLRRMPLAEAERLANDFGVPWDALTATVPVPTRVRFMDKARSRFEPDEDGGFALWVMPVCVVDERFEEEIEAVDPLRCVRKGPVVDLVSDSLCERAMASCSGPSSRNTSSPSPFRCGTMSPTGSALAVAASSY